MVIMAHPDDAEFVCGGTVAKWCAEGWDVRYVVVTGGDKGTHDPTMHPEKLAAIREEEQRAACRRLGVAECILLGYPDGFTVDEHELRGQTAGAPAGELRGRARAGRRRRRDGRAPRRPTRT